MAIPQDLLMEILSRLTVKSLIRFMCVCNHWSTTIKDRKFIQLHLSHSKKNCKWLMSHHGGWPCEHFLVSSSGAIEHCPMPAVDAYTRPNFNFTYPCDGIFCLYVSYQDCVILSNPATREFKQIPRSHNLTRTPCILGLGFGFDRKTRDKKVVRIASIKAPPFDYEILVEVYNFADDSWRKIRRIYPVHPYPYLGYYFRWNIAMSLNGVYYWMATGKDVIISFDFSEEVLRIIEFPEEVIGNSEIRVYALGMFEGSVAMIVRTAGKGFGIWQLKYDSGSGDAQFLCKKIIDELPLESYQPLGFWNDRILIEISGGRLILCDPYAEELIDIGICDNVLKRGFEYVESLSSL